MGRLIVRDATSLDLAHVDRMMGCLRDVAAPWAAYDRQHFGSRFAAITDSPDGFAAILEADGHPRGLLLAMVASSLFSPEPVATELAWWIDAPMRGFKASKAMLEAYEAWAKSRGAKHVGLATPDERVGKMMKRRGYVAAETVYRLT